jgi:hypothetical protein
MLPDLRFLIGAVLATALLGVTVFGLAAAMHISRQSKLAPIETSRLLAYTPDGGYRFVDVPARRFDNPFANIPADPNPVPLQQPLQLTAEPTPAAEPVPPAALPVQTAAAGSADPPAADHDTVDERAVVDPPLSQDSEPQTTAEPAHEPTAEPVPAPAPETTPAAPALAAAPIETTPIEATPIETAPIETAPVATAPAASTPEADTPAPSETPPEVREVGSIPPAAESDEVPSKMPAGAEISAMADTVETPEPKAKRKRAVRKAVRPKPPPRRPAASRQTVPFAFTGYPVSTATTAAAAATASRPAKGFWPLD